MTPPGHPQTLGVPFLSSRGRVGSPRPMLAMPSYMQATQALADEPTRPSGEGYDTGHQSVRHRGRIGHGWFMFSEQWRVGGSRQAEGHVDRFITLT